MSVTEWRMKKELAEELAQTAQQIFDLTSDAEAKINESFPDGPDFRFIRKGFVTLSAGASCTKDRCKYQAEAFDAMMGNTE